MRALPLYRWVAPTLLTMVIFLLSGCGQGKDLYHYQIKPPIFYTIQGSVVSPEGKPIPNVPVILHNMAPTTRIVITMTNGEGNFRFNDLKDEVYQIVPQKEGLVFTPTKRAVRLLENRSSVSTTFQAMSIPRR